MRLARQTEIVSGRGSSRTVAITKSTDGERARIVLEFGGGVDSTAEEDALREAGPDGRLAHVIAVHDRGLRPIYDWLVQGSYASVKDHQALAKELQRRAGATCRELILARPRYIGS